MSDASDSEGVAFISTAEAAERSVLTRDYVAYLCRTDKVRAQQDEGMSNSPWSTADWAAIAGPTRWWSRPVLWSRL